MMEDKSGIGTDRDWGSIHQSVPTLYIVKPYHGILLLTLFLGLEGMGNYPIKGRGGEGFTFGSRTAR